MHATQQTPYTLDALHHAGAIRRITTLPLAHNLCKVQLEQCTPREASGSCKLRHINCRAVGCAPVSVRCRTLYALQASTLCAASLCQAHMLAALHLPKCSLVQTARI
jgi:hypothetical protein